MRPTNFFLYFMYQLIGSPTDSVTNQLNRIITGPVTPLLALDKYDCKDWMLNGQNASRVLKWTNGPLYSLGAVSAPLISLSANEKL